MDFVLSGILGVAIGDALGVPVEFTSREYLRQRPVTTMIGYGTYNQPKGTWSDDSSLTFCLAQSLLKGYNLKDIAEKFVGWRDNAYWTPYADVFDIGNQTDKAISKLKRILKTNNFQELDNLRDNTDERTNGNGSLMRILPLFFFLKDKNLNEQFQITWNVSALTHPHIISAMACFFYLRFIHYLTVKSKFDAFDLTKKEVEIFFNKNVDINDLDIEKFNKIFSSNFNTLSPEEIDSDGYVIHSLEASVWTFLNTNSFEHAVLTAVNLGVDTDTTAAITGGISGIYYGSDSFPINWINSLARKNDIFNLCNKFSAKYTQE